MTNYEVDKTVRVTRSATGNVKRLNAAVVVNNRSVTDAKGKTTQVPLAADEIEKLTALVRESIGFNKERGDSVKVINAPFKVEPAQNAEVSSFWKSPDLIDIVRVAALPAGLALVAVLVFFGLVRPAVKTALLAPAGAAAALRHAARRRGRRSAAVCRRRSPRRRCSAKSKARRRSPRTTRRRSPGIVRGWVGGGEAA